MEIFDIYNLLKEFINGIKSKREDNFKVYIEDIFEI